MSFATFIAEIVLIVLAVGLSICIAITEPRWWPSCERVFGDKLIRFFGIWFVVLLTYVIVKLAE